VAKKYSTFKLKQDIKALKVNNATNWAQELSNLKECHKKIAKELKGDRIVFFDVPVYFNVGDILIYLGTEQFFLDNNLDVKYRCDYKNINHKKIMDCDTIVFQGGGNFGDLYGLLQGAREKIIEQYPDKKIICLPQTIHFQELNNEERSARKYRAHKNITIYVRDKSSFETAKKFTDKVEMMPDMAHSLHPLVDTREVNQLGNRILFMKRDDGETRNSSFKVNKRSVDWNDFITIEDRLFFYVYKLLTKIGFKELPLNMWRKKIENLFFRSSIIFNSHDEVHTDRLHGMIFSVLLGKRTFVNDNSYGKNKGYYDCWLGNIKIITFNGED